MAVSGGRDISDHEEIVRTVLSAPALQEACTGDDDPRLWRLSGAEGLLDDLWDKVDLGSHEDPHALLEAHGHTLRLFHLLREALVRSGK